MQTIKSVEVKGRRTRVLIESDSDQPPIVLLHGVGRSLEDWQPQFSLLRQAGYRVIAPEPARQRIFRPPCNPHHAARACAEHARHP